MPVPRIPPQLMLVGASVFWGAHWVMARAITADVTPVALSFWRWAIAMAILAPFAWRPLVRDRAKLLAAWPRVLFFGTIGTVVYNALTYLGLRDSTATNGLLMQSLIPVLIPLFAWLLFRDRIQGLTVAGIALSLAGVLCIAFRLDPVAAAAFRFAPGDAWLFANVTLWALYTACLRWTPKDVHPLAMFYAVMIAGMATGVPAFLVERAAGGGVDWSPPVAAAILYMGAFPSAVCFLLWNRGVELLGPARSGPFIHVTPVSGILMAWIFLGERLHDYHVAGIVLIASGLVLASRRGVA